MSYYTYKASVQIFGGVINYTSITVPPIAATSSTPAKGQTTYPYVRSILLPPSSGTYYVSNNSGNPKQSANSTYNFDVRCMYGYAPSTYGTVNIGITYSPPDSKGLMTPLSFKVNSAKVDITDSSGNTISHTLSGISVSTTFSAITLGSGSMDIDSTPKYVLTGATIKYAA